MISKECGGKFPCQNTLGGDGMADNIVDLQRRYARAEAERMRLRHLNATLRQQVESGVRPGAIELSPLSKGFMPSDERHSHVRTYDTDELWKNFASSNLGLNKRYRIYIGYLYERMGWQVDYSGGRNLISRKDNKLIVTISEAIMTVDLSAMQALLGAAMECKRDNPSTIVSAMCVTSSALISRVSSLAKKFSIAVREHFYFRNFPCVRCKAYSEIQRVYYVPDDEEYLSVKMFPEYGDRYCWSPDEAEAMRFYRPY